MMLSAVAIIVFRSSLGAITNAGGPEIRPMQFCPTTRVEFIGDLKSAPVKNENSCTCFLNEDDDSPKSTCKVGEACLPAARSDDGVPSKISCIPETSIYFEAKDNTQVSTSDPKIEVQKVNETLKVKKCDLAICGCGINWDFSIEQAGQARMVLPLVYDDCKKDMMCGYTKISGQCFKQILQFGEKCSADESCLYWCEGSKTQLEGKCWGFCSKGETGYRGQFGVICASEKIDQTKVCGGDKDCACLFVHPTTKIEYYAQVVPGGTCSNDGVWPIGYKTTLTRPGFCTKENAPCLCKLNPARTDNADICLENELCGFDQRQKDWTKELPTLCAKQKLQLPSQCSHNDHCYIEHEGSPFAVVPFGFSGVPMPLFGDVMSTETKKDIPGFNPTLSNFALYKTSIEHQAMCQDDFPWCGCLSRWYPNSIRLCSKTEYCKNLYGPPSCISTTTNFGFCREKNPTSKTESCTCNSKDGSLKQICPKDTFCAEFFIPATKPGENFSESTKCFPEPQVIEVGASCTNPEGCVCVRNKKEWDLGSTVSDRGNYAICINAGSCVLDVLNNLTMCLNGFETKNIGWTGTDAHFLCKGEKPNDLIFCVKGSTCITRPIDSQNAPKKAKMYPGNLLCASSTQMYHSQIVEDPVKSVVYPCGSGPSMKYCFPNEQCIKEKPKEAKDLSTAKSIVEFEQMFIDNLSRDMFWRRGVVSPKSSPECVLPNLGNRNPCTKEMEPCWCLTESPLSQPNLWKELKKDTTLDSSDIDELCKSSASFIESGPRRPIAVKCNLNDICMQVDGGPFCAKINQPSSSPPTTYYGSGCAVEAAVPQRDVATKTVTPVIQTKSCHYGEMCVIQNKKPSCKRTNPGKLMLGHEDKCILYEGRSCICATLDGSKKDTCNPGHTCIIQGEKASCVVAPKGAETERFICPANQYCYCSALTFWIRKFSNSKEVVCVKKTSSLKKDDYEEDKKKYPPTLDFDLEVGRRILNRTYRFEGSAKAMKQIQANKANPKQPVKIRRNLFGSDSLSLGEKSAMLNPGMEARLAHTSDRPTHLQEVIGEVYGSQKTFEKV